MDRPASVVAGGVAGTALLSLLLFILDVETRSAVGIFEAIARFVGVSGQPVLGFALFVLAGILAWPLLFMAVEPYIPRSDPAAKGAIFAIPLWAAFVFISRGDMTGPLFVVYASFTLLAHLAYGFTLGAVSHRLEVEP
jgi:hypothetical protein